MAAEVVVVLTEAIVLAGRVVPPPRPAVLEPGAALMLALALDLVAVRIWQLVVRMEELAGVVVLTAEVVLLEAVVPPVVVPVVAAGRAKAVEISGTSPSRFAIASRLNSRSNPSDS